MGAGADEQPERKTDATQLPFAYHGMPTVWYDEVIHTFFVKSIVDLTPGDAKFAWQALVHRIGYVGIAFTPAHASAIYNRLKGQIKEDMCKPGSRMFSAQYAKAVGVETDNDKGGPSAGAARASAGAASAGRGGPQPPCTGKGRGRKRGAAVIGGSGGASGSGGGGGKPSPAHGKEGAVGPGGDEGAGGVADRDSPTFADMDELDDVWDTLKD